MMLHPTAKKWTSSSVSKFTFLLLDGKSLEPQKQNFKTQRLKNRHSYILHWVNILSFGGIHNLREKHLLRALLILPPVDTESGLHRSGQALGILP